MKTQSNFAFPLPIEETTLQAIAQKMGNQISHVVCAAFMELLLMMKEETRQADVSSPQSVPPAPQLTALYVAKVLNISKNQTYQLIRSKELRSFSVG